MREGAKADGERFGSVCPSLKGFAFTGDRSCAFILVPREIKISLSEENLFKIIVFYREYNELYQITK